MRCWGAGQGPSDLIFLTRHRLL